MCKVTDRVAASDGRNVVDCSYGSRTRLTANHPLADGSSAGTLLVTMFVPRVLVDVGAGKYQ